MFNIRGIGTTRKISVQKDPDLFNLFKLFRIFSTNHTFIKPRRGV